MADARERLKRLIELAGEKAPEKQRALAFELCDLLTDWPPRYALAMREPFEALLEKVLRLLDGTTRRMIAARLARNSDTAIALLDAFFLDMPAEARAAILRRQAGTEEPPAAAAVAPADETPLIEAARTSQGAELAQVFARCLRIPPTTARRILEDTSGSALAVACKGGQIGRATYSALALLTARDARAGAETRQARLTAFDEISEARSSRLLAHWQRESEAQQPGVQAA